MSDPLVLNITHTAYSPSQSSFNVRILPERAKPRLGWACKSAWASIDMVTYTTYTERVPRYAHVPKRLVFLFELFKHALAHITKLAKLEASLIEVKETEGGASFEQTIGFGPLGGRLGGERFGKQGIGENEERVGWRGGRERDGRWSRHG